MPKQLRLALADGHEGHSAKNWAAMLGDAR